VGGNEKRSQGQTLRVLGTSPGPAIFCRTRSGPADSGRSRSDPGKDSVWRFTFATAGDSLPETIRSSPDDAEGSGGLNGSPRFRRNRASPITSRGRIFYWKTHQCTHAISAIVVGNRWIIVRSEISEVERTDVSSPRLEVSSLKKGDTHGKRWPPTAPYLCPPYPRAAAQPYTHSRCQLWKCISPRNSKRK
jgi:hypothetical protein